MRRGFWASLFGFVRSLVNLVSFVLHGNRIPPIPNLRDDRILQIILAGLIRALLMLGKPGSGKTRILAFLITLYMMTFPDRGILVIDASGKLKNDILGIIQLQPEEVRERLTKRLVIDIPFHPEYTHTMPEWHADYGVDMELQIQRSAEVLRRLNPEIELAPILGAAAFKEMFPELARLLTAIQNEHGETWQITEAKKLLIDGSQMALAIKQAGGRAPSAKWYFEAQKQATSQERDMRSYALRSALGVVEPRELRARVGYYKPSWTVGELERKGLCCIVSGEYMLGREQQFNYVVMQIHSLFRMQMNQRRPDDPAVKPFLYVLEEVPALYQIPGMAQEIAGITSFYRSRKVEVILSLQATWQVDKSAAEHIWSLGNLLVFGLDDFNDARLAAEHLFYYGPTTVKQESRTATQNPITEPEHGQYTAAANWIQSFRQREVVIRRYFSESQMDRFVRHVTRIQDIPVSDNAQAIGELSEQIFRSRAISIREALEVINQRVLVPEKTNANNQVRQMPSQ
jgi:hypothetical protein